ncbi:MAG: hypothetical protein Q9198_007922, partial [Flavoplaca austrocitrina]
RGVSVFPNPLSNPSCQLCEVGSVQSSSQDDDVVYAAHKEKIEIAAGSDPYVGGPVHCLGGRSTVRGLYSPMIDSTTVGKYFLARIAEYLHKGGFEEAFDILTNGSQKVGDVYPTSGDMNKVEAQAFRQAEHVLHTAMMDFHAAHTAQVQTSPRPGEKLPWLPGSKHRVCTHFPKGAYSTVDALIETTYARSANLTILLNSEVISVNTLDEPGIVKDVIVRLGPDAQLRQLSARRGIILCAGTIGTAAIALHSGSQQKIPLVGKGLTDHEIWGNGRRTFKPAHEAAMRDQIMWCRGLAECSDQRQSLLGRRTPGYEIPTQSSSHTGDMLGNQAPDEPQSPCDTVNVTVEFPTALEDSSEVLNTSTCEPVIHIKRPAPRGNEVHQEEMQGLVTSIRNAILNIKGPQAQMKAPRLSLAGFSVVAHEVGIMRLGGSDGKGVVDDKYRVDGFKNLYVCDLSAFPVSAPANPTLTLAAMAMQLAGDLVENGGMKKEL